VLERLAHGTDDYAPGNLPGLAQVVVTDTAQTNKAQQLANAHATELLRLRASNTEKVLRSMAAHSLLYRVRKAMSIGRSSYYLYLAAVLGAVVDVGAMLASLWQGGGFSPAGLVIGTGWGMVAAALAAAFLLSLWVDNHLSNVFSGEWYRKHDDLRKALKDARIQVATSRNDAPVVRGVA